MSGSPIPVMSFRASVASRDPTVPHRPGSTPPSAQSSTVSGAGGATPLSASELVERLRSGVPPRLVDVRSAEERAERRLRDSEWEPLDRIVSGAATPSGPVTIYCERDPRSVRAAEALLARGKTEVSFLRGGIDELARLAPDLIERGG
ncbi:hypothetical protein BMH30_12365 [Leucobacter sp. OLES1]|nr:hypothetical protein BMH30_12365 [Leucobacter sp. OLES1]